MEEIEDVKQNSSPVPEDVNNDSSVQESADSSTAQGAELSATEQPAKKDSTGGVDYEEVARHVTRFLAPQLKQQVEERLSQFQQPQVTQPQTSADPVQSQLAPYTDEQLEAWSVQDPNNAMIYRKEINRRIEDRASNKAYERFKGESAKERFEREQQDSISFLQTSFPDAFINIGGQGQWNSQNPLVQRAFSLYNSDPAFKAHGRGLRAAFLQAKGEIALEESGHLMKQKAQITAQQRKLEKGTAQAMATGGQSSPAPAGNSTKVKLAKLLEQHKKTGDPKVMAEILRLKGNMPSFA